MGEVRCAGTLHGPRTIPIEKRVTGRVVFLCYPTTLKKKAMEHFSEVLINHNCYRSRQKLQMLRLQGVRHWSQTRQVLCFLSFFSLACLFCSPEQHCRALPIGSEPLPLSEALSQTSDHSYSWPMSGAVEITPAGTVRNACPASSDRRVIDVCFGCGAPAQEPLPSAGYTRDSQVISIEKANKHQSELMLWPHRAELCPWGTAWDSWAWPPCTGLGYWGLSWYWLSPV